MVGKKIEMIGPQNSYLLKRKTLFYFSYSVGRKKDIVKSQSLNIDQGDVIDAPSKDSDAEALFGIEQHILTDDGEYFQYMSISFIC